MNATEARKQAADVREKNRKDREKAKADREKAKAERLKEACAKETSTHDMKKACAEETSTHDMFVKDFNENADKSIADAVRKGKKYTFLFLGYSDRKCDVYIWFTNHVYIADIKRTIARLRRAGFYVINHVESDEAYSDYETGETYTYYRANLKVSWE